MPGESYESPVREGPSLRTPGFRVTEQTHEACCLVCSFPALPRHASSSYDDVDGIGVAFISVGVRAILGAWVVGVSYVWQNKKMSNARRVTVSEDKREKPNKRLPKSIPVLLYLRSRQRAYIITSHIFDT